MLIHKKVFLFLAYHLRQVSPQNFVQIFHIQQFLMILFNEIYVPCLHLPTVRLVGLVPLQRVPVISVCIR